MKKGSMGIVKAGVIAGIYVVLTFVSAAFGLSSGVIQVRLSEALCVLPVFLPQAIPGLFAGCVIANTLTGGLPMDILFGSLATLIGAVGTRLLRKNRILALLLPILSNTLIIPFVLKFTYGIPGSLWYFMLTVGLGEVVSCGVLGYFLGREFDKRSIFK